MKKRNHTVMIHCHYRDQSLERLDLPLLFAIPTGLPCAHFLAFSSSHSWLQESPFTDSHIPHVASTKDWNPRSVLWGGACFSCNYGLYCWWLMFLSYLHSSLCGHRISVLCCVILVRCNTVYLCRCHQIKENIEVGNTFCFSRWPLTCIFWILKSNSP